LERAPRVLYFPVVLLLSDEGTSRNDFAWELWPEYGLDCLICAGFARQW